MSLLLPVFPSLMYSSSAPLSREACYVGQLLQGSRQVLKNVRGAFFSSFEVQGDRFRINITNNLDDPTMPMSTSIVRYPILPHRVSLNVHFLALAWSLSARNELGRWRFLRQSMPNHSSGVIPIRLSRGGSGWYFLVPFPLLFAQFQFYVYT